MAKLDAKNSLACRTFRRTGQVTLETNTGETVTGAGLISALRQNTGEPGGLRHSLGVLPRPMYRFTGWLPETENAVGGVMIRGEKRYRVLDLRPLYLGERELCVRALLERLPDEEEGERP